jgi:hypothetical protein
MPERQKIRNSRRQWLIPTLTAERSDTLDKTNHPAGSGPQKHWLQRVAPIDDSQVTEGVIREQTGFRPIHGRVQGAVSRQRAVDPEMRPRRRHQQPSVPRPPDCKLATAAGS